jgi:hypothetical protein
MSSLWLMLKPDVQGRGSLGPEGVLPVRVRGRACMRLWEAMGRHYAAPGIGAGGNPSPAPPPGLLLVHIMPAHRGRIAKSTARRNSSAQLSQCLMAVSRMRPRRFSHS